MILNIGLVEIIYVIKLSVQLNRRIYDSYDIVTSRQWANLRQGGSKSKILQNIFQKIFNSFNFVPTLFFIFLNLPQL